MFDVVQKDKNDPKKVLRIEIFVFPRSEYWMDITELTGLPVPAYPTYLTYLPTLPYKKNDPSKEVVEVLRRFLYHHQQHPPTYLDKQHERHAAGVPLDSLPVNIIRGYWLTPLRDKKCETRSARQEGEE